MTRTATRTSELIVMLSAIAVCLCAGCSQTNSRVEAQLELSDELARRQDRQAESFSHYQLAAEAFDKDDLKAARKHLYDAIGAYDRNAQAWMLLGLLEHREDRVFEAASCFNKASLLAPDRYEPIYNIAILLESFGRYKQAIESYQAALKLSPGQPEVMENLARCCIRADTNLDQAKDLVDKALLTEQRPEWRQWLGEQSRRLRAKGGVGP